MANEYPFVGRESELTDLRSAFSDRVLRGHGCLAYLVQGRNGVGKTRLMTEFIRSIQEDVLLHSDIADFRLNEHVMVYDCSQSLGKPYEPFKSITEKIHSQQRLLHLATETFFLVLSVFNVDTILGHLKSIGAILLGKETRDDPAEKETVLFNRYRRLLAWVNRKAPLIIFLQNAQRIDIQSLKLLNKVIHDRKPLWGMIILEDQQDHVPDSNIQESLNRMVGSGVLSRIVVRSLGKEFPSRLLSKEFGEDLFDGGEFDVMYAISEGCPGILINEVEAWKRNGWIESRGQRWEKCADFKEKIKPKAQKLLELVVALFEDRILTEGEERLIYRMAADWGIANDSVARTIGMARDISNCNYKIVRRIGPGIVSVDSFEALDEAGSHFIIEYIRNEKQLPVTFRRLGVVHANLLEAREVRPCGGGVLVCWDYREGRRIREIMREAHETQIKKSIAMLKQIAPALAEMHRVGEAHGYIQPESIIETSDARFCLASFDASLLNVLLPSMRPDRESLNYLAPETLGGKAPDPRSDIFALGVLFYNLLTNRFPFDGGTPEELLQSMKRGTKIVGDETALSIPLDIQSLIAKCVNFYPENRYQNAAEFLVDLNKVNLDWHPPQAPPAPPVPVPEKRPPRKRIITAGAVLLFAVAAAAAGWHYLKEFWTEKTIVPAITIGIKEGETTARVKKPLSARATQFLIMDDLTQSSNQLVYSETMFSRIYAAGGHHVPRLAVKGEILSGDLEYELRLTYVTPDGKQGDTVFVFHDPSSLLHDISRITLAILARVNVHSLKPSTFTRNWDAFESFFAGDTAWRRLNVTQAEQHFRSALAIDSTFVLAMVRLADVYRFNGQRAEALALLERAMPRLAELSTPDSLRAEALQCRLSGRLWEAVDIYRQIVNLSPGRRSAVYDLAEGYYQLREVEQAAEQYRVALMLDPAFAPAYNHLGYCYSHLGMHDSALACFRKYLALDRSANAFDSMGDGFFAAGMLDSAIWAKEQGIHIDPQLGYLYSSLAYIQIRAGRQRAATENIQRYINYAGTDKELLASGHALTAYLRSVQNDQQGALEACRRGLREFDSMKLESRNHQLHWLVGITSLRLGNTAAANKELSAMERLISENGVNAKQYNEVYKFWLHLRAAIDARQGSLNGFNVAVIALDGQFQTKVKDGGSSFDLAYFNTALGVLLMESKLGTDLQIETRFKTALAYNPRFPGALYHSRIFYSARRREEDARRMDELFRNQWASADRDATVE
jgi:tetratricopeptide (TPR) repeat protein